MTPVHNSAADDDDTKLDAELEERVRQSHLVANRLDMQMEVDRRIKTERERMLKELDKRTAAPVPVVVAAARKPKRTLVSRLLNALPLSDIDDMNDQLWRSVVLRLVRLFSLLATAVVVAIIVRWILFPSTPALPTREIIYVTVNPSTQTLPPSTSASDSARPVAIPASIPSSTGTAIVTVAGTCTSTADPIVPATERRLDWALFAATPKDDLVSWVAAIENTNEHAPPVYKTVEPTRVSLGKCISIENVRSLASTPTDPNSLMLFSASAGKFGTISFRDVRYSLAKHLLQNNYDYMCAQHVDVPLCYCMMQIRSANDSDGGSSSFLDVFNVALVGTSRDSIVLNKEATLFCAQNATLVGQVRSVRRYRRVWATFTLSDGELYERLFDGALSMSFQQIYELQNDLTPCEPDPARLAEYVKSRKL